MTDLQRYLVEEMVEEYRAGRLSRRELLRRVALITGSATVGAALLAGLGPVPPAAASVARQGAPTGVTVSPDDPDLEAGMIDYPGDGVRLIGYLARPRAEGVRPAVLQIHENRGLTEHHRDVSRRLAKQGYVSLAVDLLSRQGGTARFTDSAEATGALGQAAPEQLVADLRAAVAYLQSLPYVRSTSVGVMGFCWGGGMTWRLVTAEPALVAAVPFYGPNPPLDAVPNIRAAILAIYAGNDDRINAGIPELRAALNAAGVTYEIVIFPNTEHAFFNDTGPRYAPEAAAEAWARTLAWFERYLAPGA
ncbi:MAG TPA: dienelactone hydrolase family protein [Chloroflexota bacterium]|nr:dienelactone hydrolase family protein [Chloroflexota bacterium]